MPGRHSRQNSEWRDESIKMAQTLRQARKGRGLTQEDLAVQSGVKLSSLRAIEDGRVTEPGIFKVVLLAKALSIDLNDLLRNVHPPNSRLDA